MGGSTERSRAPPSVSCPVGKEIVLPYFLLSEHVTAHSRGVTSPINPFSSWEEAEQARSAWLEKRRVQCEQLGLVISDDAVWIVEAGDVAAAMSVLGYPPLLPRNGHRPDAGTGRS